MPRQQICHNATSWKEGPVAHDVRLSRIVTVRSRFTRSVSLPRDWERPDALDGYILTPSGRGILERLISSLDGTSPARAWSLTGPYGSGKSAFALFAGQVLGGREAVGGKARALLKEHALPLWRKLTSVSSST